MHGGGGGRQGDESDNEEKMEISRGLKFPNMDHTDPGPRGGWLPTKH